MKVWIQRARFQHTGKDISLFRIQHPKFHIEQTKNAHHSDFHKILSRFVIWYVGGEENVSRLVKASQISFIIEQQHDGIFRENWTFFDIWNTLGEPMAVLIRLSKKRLVKNNLYCKTCRLPFGLNAYKNATDAYRWFCKNC